MICFEDDKTWGQVNGYRFPVLKGSFLKKSHRVFTDTILERKENELWKWELTEFPTPFLFFAKNALGEWKVATVESDRIKMAYKYTYSSRNIFFQPLNWLFVQVQIKGMMKKAMSGIQIQAEGNDVFMY